MPAGLTVFNDDHYLVIDENFFNYSFKGKGTATVTGPVAGPVIGGYANTLIITVTGDAPIVAIKPNATHRWCYHSTTRSGNTWTFRFTGNLGSLGPQIGETVTYYVFDRPDDSGTNVGFQVFDASGKLTFDAGRKYMRLLYAGSLAIGGSLDFGTGNYGVALLNQYYFYRESPPEVGSNNHIWAMVAGTIQFNATGVTAANFEVATGTRANIDAPLPNQANGDTYLMAIDVSGY